MIANPSASGFTGAALRDVTATLSAEFAVDQEWPDGPEASRHAASKAAVASYDVVAAMGGDGVVHHVANGLVGTETALAIIPAGTTNVLARLLRVPTKPKKAARALTSWTPRPLQAIRVVADDREPFYATFALGVGYDAAVIARANQRPYGKVTWGALHYARSALRELGDHGTPTIRLEAHGLRTDGAAASIQVQDNYTFLGPLAFGFGGDSPNGFNALTLKGVRARTATTVAKMASHRLEVSEGDATVWTDVSSLSAFAEPATSMQADGESYGKIERVSIEVNERQLLILAP